MDVYRGYAVYYHKADADADARGLLPKSEVRRVDDRHLSEHGFLKGDGFKSVVQEYPRTFMQKGGKTPSDDVTDSADRLMAELCSAVGRGW